MEEIEEQPKSHKNDEDDEGDWVPEEVEEENKEHDHGSSYGSSRC